MVQKKNLLDEPTNHRHSVRFRRGSKREEMKFDDIIEHLGQFGPYQRWIYFLLCLPAAPVAMQSIVSIFIMAIPDHRCAVPNMNNDTYKIQSMAHAEAVDTYIPRDKDNAYSECQVYNVISDPLSLMNVSSNVSTSSNAGSTYETAACDRWVYDESLFSSTLVTDLDLVCELKSSRPHAQMLFMLGALCGTLLLGPPADYFGRKKLMMICLCLHISASIIISFTPSFLFLCVVFFFNGMAGNTLYSVLFVLGMELVGPKKRAYAGFIILMFYGLGVVLETGVAYLIRDWQHLQLALSSVSVLFISYYWLIPESPRWLISRERYTEAKTIIMKAARVNKKEIPTNLLQWENISIKEEEEIHEPLWRIVTYPRLVVRTIIIFLNWMTSSMTYYGLGLNVGDLAGSIYLNNLLFGIVEILSYVVCMFLLDKIGRRKLYLASVFVAGIACTASPFPNIYGGKDYQWMTVVLAIVGKFGVSAAFGTIWLYTSELFPTVVRNSGISCSSLWARIGGVISPYIANLSVTIGGDLGQLLPLLIFGGMSLFTGLLSLALPETRNTKLPETLKDANEFGRKYRPPPNLLTEMEVLTSDTIDSKDVDVRT